MKYILRYIYYKKLSKNYKCENVNEQVINKDTDLKKLFDLAKTFDDPYKFDDYLNRNKFGSNKDYQFLGERFRRLNRGTRLKNNDRIVVYRTGDEPIKWGDYIYLYEYDAIHAYNAGQGNKIYSKTVSKSDVVETSVSGEYYYSPKNIAKIGNDLIDLWNYANNKPKIKELSVNDIKDRIKLFKKELVKLKGKYDNFDEYKSYVFNLALKFNVACENYEQYF